MEVFEITLDEYKNFLKESGAFYNPLQGEGGWNKLSISHNTPRIFAGKENGEIVIAMILGFYPFKKVLKSAYSPYGYVAKDPMDTRVVKEFFDGLAPYFKKSNVCAIRFDSQIEYMGKNKALERDAEVFDNSAFRKEMLANGFLSHELSQGLSMNTQPRQVAVIDLFKGAPKGYFTPGDDLGALKTRAEWLKSCNATMRNSLKRLDVPYIQIVESDDLDLLYDMVEKSGTSKGFHSVSKQQMEDVYNAHKKAGSVKIKVAKLDVDGYLDYTEKKIEEMKAEIEQNLAKNTKRSRNKASEIEASLPRQYKNLEEAKKLKEEGYSVVDMAASMFLYSPHQAMYLWSGIDRNFDHFNASGKILESVVDDCIEQGIPQFNLLGVMGSLKPDDQENYPLVQFKLSLGGRITEYSGVYWYPIHKKMAGYLFNQIPD